MAPASILDKPLDGFSLVNVTGTCAKGFFLANIERAKISNVKVTGFAGSLLNINNVSGIGLAGAAKIEAPKVPVAVVAAEKPYQLH